MIRLEELLAATTAGDIASAFIIGAVIVAVVFGLLCLLWYWDERHWK